MRKILFAKKKKNGDAAPRISREPVVGGGRAGVTAGLGTSLGAVLWASRGRHGGWSRVRVLLEEERSDVTVGNGARCANPGGRRDYMAGGTGRGRLGSFSECLRFPVLPLVSCFVCS